jgi:hypothetical protein
MTLISLLINDSANEDQTENLIRFGGKPSAPGGILQWPTCTSCQGNMQFLGQLAPHAQDGEESLLLLFMCQNNPGLCDEWDGDSGGNLVIVVARKCLGLVEPPTTGETIRSVSHSASITNVESEDYDNAREVWAGSTGISARNVLGQIGGQPAWLQGEEVPLCDQCGKSMSFVAQLEEGPDYQTAMNFGGGCAYIYRCGCDAGQAKMLWQS